MLRLVLALGNIALLLVLSFRVAYTAELVGKQRIAMTQYKTDNHSAIQKQIDALGEKGGTVQLEARVYLINNCIVLRDNVTVRGAARDKTIIRLAPNRPKRAECVDGAVFRNENYNENKTPQGNHDITIRDLTIDADAPRNKWAGEGVLLANCYNYRLENLRIMNCRGYAGIYTNPCHMAARKKIPYQNYIVNCIVEGNRPANDRGAPYGHGIYVTAWDNDNVLIKGNITRNNHASGIHLEDDVAYVFVENNESYNNGGNGIWLCEASRSTVKFNKVHDNKGYGIALSQGKGNEQNLISGNEVYRNGYAGIVLNRQYDAGNSYAVVVGNRIWSNNQTASADHGGILIVETANCNTIGFNYIYDNQEKPTQDYGLVVMSCDNTIISNRIEGNRLGDVKIAENKNNVLVPWAGTVCSPETTGRKHQYNAKEN